MTFNKLVAVVAIISLASQASAQGDGTLRRVAQNDQTIITTEVNTTTVAPVQVQETAPVQAPAPTAIVQPATVVEASPVVESKAEALRKARQNAEISTEQKIVEKLEESRLREEQERADRLFGSKLDATAAAQLQQAVQASQQAPAPEQTVVTPAAPIAPITPTQVTIEKVEIIQPVQSNIAPPEIKSVSEVKEAPAPVAPVAASTSSISASDVEEEEVQSQKWYISGSLGGVNYDASNVKTNFGGGFAIGLLMNERAAVEAGFLYSNHYIDTFWNPGLYREMEQYDISLSAKYNVLTDRLRPYVGAGLAYIIRNYQQRMIMNNYYGGVQTANGPSEDQTEAVNFTATVGLDFLLTENISIGGSADYSTNIMNRNEFNFNRYYSHLPENVKAIEEIDFYTLKINAKLSF